MKIRNLNKSVVLVVFIFTMSCEDLDLQPLNSSTEATFYTNAENLHAGLFGVYSALQSRYMYGHQVVLDGLSDNAISTSFLGDIQLFGQGLDFPGSAEVTSMYREPYVLIQRANLLLDNADGTSGISEEDLQLIKAEVKTLRAMAYMRLVYLFGDVPLITTSLERSEFLEVNRTARSQIIDFIISELDAASDVLNNEPASDARLTKQLALGVKAKVQLYEARLGNISWSAALTSINQAVSEASKSHELIDTDNPQEDYKSLFTMDNENNLEFIFSVKNNNLDTEIFSEFFSWQSGVLQMYVHQNLADAYTYADGSEYNPADNTYVGRDPRLSVNIMHPGLSFGGETYGVDASFVKGNAGGSATGLFLYKFSTTDFISSMNYDAGLDVPVLRYADLLLMQAEALNETDADGHAQLNMVRDRAGLPALIGLSKDEFRDEVIKERRLELAFEGQRWFDLITLGIADETINGIEEEDAIVIRAFTSGRSELLPIPETERSLNSNLEQNQGY